MDAVELREIQAPIKAQYREDPDSAVITLKAEGLLVRMSAVLLMLAAPLWKPACILLREVLVFMLAPATCCLKRWWHVPVLP